MGTEVEAKKAKKARYSSDYSRWTGVGDSDEEDERTARQAQHETHVQRHLSAKSGGVVVADPAAAAGANPTAPTVLTPGEAGAPWQGSSISDWLVQAQQRQAAKRGPGIRGDEEPVATRRRGDRYCNDYARFADIGSDDEMEVTEDGGGLGVVERPLVGTATGPHGTIPGQPADIDAPLTDEEFELLQAHTREQLGLPQPPPLPPECREDPSDEVPARPQPTVKTAPFIDPVAGPSQVTSPAHRPATFPLPRAGERRTSGAAGMPAEPELIQVLRDTDPDPTAPAAEPEPAAGPEPAAEPAAAEPAAEPSVEPAAKAAEAEAGQAEAEAQEASQGSPAAAQSDAPAEQAPASEGTLQPAEPVADDKPVGPSAESVLLEGEKVQPGVNKLTVNGGRVGDRYLWSQTEETATVHFVVPKGTRAKMLQPFMSARAVGVALLPCPGAPPLPRDLVGTLAFRVQQPEDGWSSPEWELIDWPGDGEGRRLVSITMKKHATPGAFAWWTRVFHGDPEINLEDVLLRSAERVQKLKASWEQEKKNLKERKMGAFSNFFDY